MKDGDMKSIGVCSGSASIFFSANSGYLGTICPGQKAVSGKTIGDCIPQSATVFVEKSHKYARYVVDNWDSFVDRTIYLFDYENSAVASVVRVEYCDLARIVQSGLSTRIEAIPVYETQSDNILLFEKLKALYGYIPKVACSAIKLSFARHLSMDFDNIHNAKFDRFDRLKMKESKRLGYFSFAFVRNPWDRIVSCYLNKLNYHESDMYSEGNPNWLNGAEIRFYAPYKGRVFPRMSFRDFCIFVSGCPDDVSNGHWRSQSAFLRGDKGLLPFDYIGKFETIGEDWKVVCGNLGVDLVLPYCNVTGNRSDYRNYYDSETKDIIYRRYKDDVDLFDYDY